MLHVIRRDWHRGHPLMSMRTSEAAAGFLFLTPWILGFLIFTLGPLLSSIYFSFTEYPILQPARWIGLQNYRVMLTQDPLFWHSLRLTTIYTVAVVPLQVTFGYLLALLLNERARGIAFFRTAFFIPSIVPTVAASFIWLWLFQPDLGLINNFLGTFGIPGPTWFASADWALPALVFVSAWSVGNGMLIYLAGLQGVPTTLYEAAKLDGAGAWSRFRHVTVPMTSPVILFNVIVGLIGTFQSFTSVFIMTQGGPMNATLFYVYYLYQNGWKYFKMGYASALAWVLCVIIFVLTLAMLRASQRLVYYEGGLRS